MVPGGLSDIFHQPSQPSRWKPIHPSRRGAILVMSLVPTRNEGLDLSPAPCHSANATYRRGRSRGRRAGRVLLVDGGDNSLHALLCAVLDLDKSVNQALSIQMVGKQRLKDADVAAWMRDLVAVLSCSPRALLMRASMLPNTVAGVFVSVMVFSFVCGVFSQPALFWPGLMWLAA